MLKSEKGPNSTMKKLTEKQTNKKKKKKKKKKTGKVSSFSNFHQQCIHMKFQNPSTVDSKDMRGLKSVMYRWMNRQAKSNMPSQVPNFFYVGGIKIIF